MAYGNLGNLLQKQKQYQQAENLLHQAVELQPNDTNSHLNLGLTLYRQGFMEEAEIEFRKVLSLDSNNQFAHLNLGLLLLLTERFKEGFIEYEWRLKASKIELPLFNKPRWQGEDLQGKTLLITSEQGLGDTIQFIGYAPILKQMGAKVKLTCQKSLINLCLNTGYFHQVLESKKKLHCDYNFYLPIMSLPYILGEKFNNIATNIPYLKNWHQSNLTVENPFNSKYKIGIVWASDIKNPGLYVQKSCAVEFFISLLKIKNISLYSLQVGVDSDSINQYLNTSRIIDLSPLLKDFTDTAAAISELDLVISIDTAVVHLAGAMGTKVWTLLPFIPDWRWFLDQKDTPWYPTMNLFRQPKLDDWISVFVEIGNSLAEFVGDKKTKFIPADFQEAQAKNKQILSLFLTKPLS